MAYTCNANIINGSTNPTVILSVPSGKHAIITTFRIATTSTSAKNVKVYCTNGNTFNDSVCIFSAAIDASSPVQWSGDVLPGGWKIAVEGEGVNFFVTYWLS